MPSPFVTDFTAAAYYIAEGTTPRLAFTVEDEDGVALGASDLDTLELSLYDYPSGVIVNACEHTDILNADRGTLDEAGAGVIQFVADDTALAGRRPLQERRALIGWSWDTEAKVGWHLIRLVIQELAKVPAPAPTP